MKSRTLVSILIIVLAVLIVTDNYVTASDKEVFFQSVRSGDYAGVKKLIEEGTDVNAQTKEGVPALMIASIIGHIEVAKLLIEEGADVNTRDNDGGTALIWASQEGHTEVVKLLIKEEADVNAQNNVGYTALMAASVSGHTEIVKLLKDAGAKE